MLKSLKGYLEEKWRTDYYTKAIGEKSVLMVLLAVNRLCSSSKGKSTAPLFISYQVFKQTKRNCVWKCKKIFTSLPYFWITKYKGSQSIKAPYLISFQERRKDIFANKFKNVAYILLTAFHVVNQAAYVIIVDQLTLTHLNW